MVLVLAATGTELGELETAGGRLLILGGGIVPLFADGALQCDDFAHFDVLLSWPATSAGKQLCLTARRDTGLDMAPAAKS